MEKKEEESQLPLALQRVKRSRPNFVHKLPDESKYKPAAHAIPITMPSHIKNKRRRQELYVRMLAEKQKLKARHRKMEQAAAKQRATLELTEEQKAAEEQEASKRRRVQRTLENTREADDTTVMPNDEEVIRDQAVDEFAPMFQGVPNADQEETVGPKLLFTTSMRPSHALKRFVKEAARVFPNAEYRKRNRALVKPMVRQCSERGYTAVFIWEENHQQIDSLLCINLPEGPTAHFRVTSIRLPKQLRHHGKLTQHQPEIILNNFTTRLGHDIGRMFASWFPNDPEFRGRRAITFHNQRDFIFFRHHRYIFDDKKSVRLQELGPRFTLNLISLQKGTFDTKYGEYLWIRKKEMETSRRRFFL